MLIEAIMIGAVAGAVCYALGAMHREPSPEGRDLTRATARYLESLALAGQDLEAEAEAEDLEAKAEDTRDSGKTGSIVPVEAIKVPVKGKATKSRRPGAFSSSPPASTSIEGADT